MLYQHAVGELVSMLIWGRGLAVHFGKDFVDKNERGDQHFQGKHKFWGKLHCLKEILSGKGPPAKEGKKVLVYIEVHHP